MPQSESDDAVPWPDGPSNAVEYILEDGRRFAWSESSVCYEEVPEDGGSFSVLRRRLLECERKRDAEGVLLSCMRIWLTGDLEALKEQLADVPPESKFAEVFRTQAAELERILGDDALAGVRDRLAETDKLLWLAGRAMRAFQLQENGGARLAVAFNRRVSAFALESRGYTIQEFIGEAGGQGKGAE